MKPVEKIQEILDSKNIKASKMMKDLGFSSGLFSQWKAGKQQVSLEKIVSIATYFDCSVDYLLGRTDNPQTIDGQSIKTEEIHDDNNANMDINTKKLSKETIELAEMIENLSLIERSKVILFIEQIAKQKEKIQQQPDIQISQIPEKAIARSKGNPFREVPTPEQIASFTPVPEDSDL